MRFRIDHINGKMEAHVKYKFIKTTLTADIVDTHLYIDV